jgi:hypothetical protein
MAREMETTFIRKLKRRGASGLWSAYVLDVDAHGRWLFSPKGSLYRGEEGGLTGLCEVGQGNPDAGLLVLHLVPRGGWWIAAWAGDWTYPWVSIDIATPATLVEGAWTYDDLELDLVSREPGVVQIEDEDEFAAACDQGLITAREQLDATTATAELRRILRSLREPLGNLGPQRLGMAIRLELPPLTDLP